MPNLRPTRQRIIAEAMRLFGEQGYAAEQAGPQAPERDWLALAAVAVNATTHYWLLGDIFGKHPAGIDEDRYVAVLADLAAALLQND